MDGRGNEALFVCCCSRIAAQLKLEHDDAQRYRDLALHHHIATSLCLNDAVSSTIIIKIASNVVASQQCREHCKVTTVALHPSAFISRTPLSMPLTLTSNNFEDANESALFHYRKHASILNKCTGQCYLYLGFAVVVEFGHGSFCAAATDCPRRRSSVVGRRRFSEVVEVVEVGRSLVVVVGMSLSGRRCCCRRRQSYRSRPRRCCSC